MQHLIEGLVNFMLKHIVVYKARTQEDVFRFKQDVEALRGVVEDIVSIEVVIDLLSTSTASAILVSQFKDAEGLERYKNHPEHVKVAEFVKDVFEARLCADYIEE